MERYYTPTIEEINIGDRFYIQGGQERICTEVSAYPHVGGSTIDVPIKDRSFDKFLLEHVRLKYLDQEDIESLGFEFQEHNVVTEFRNGSWAIAADFKGEPHVHIVDEYVDFIHFSGQCKNKSELRKLLNQVGAPQQNTK